MGFSCLKLLILSFYYQPDLSAGSFRTTALIKALLEQLPEAVEIELITTLPNRYSTFSIAAAELEVLPRLTIRRIALPPHHGGMVDQSKVFLAYARGVLKLVADQQYSMVYATSSRLMTAALGAWVARRARTPLYLDIRDIFVDTIGDVLPKKMVWAIKPIFSCLEWLTIRSAGKVNLVSAGFLPYFKQRYPRQRYSLFTNGIDDEFLPVLPAHAAHESRELVVRDVLDIVYAGNMGEGQGLHGIIPQLAKRFEGRLQFRIIGDGGKYRQLVEALAAAQCHNVQLCAPLSRAELIEVYRSADVLFLHLNDYQAFRKVLPSKLFEYAALGKPIWAGVAGYAADFVRQNISNSAVFPPCDVDSAVKVFESLRLATEPRATFVEQYSRGNIMREMARDISSELQSGMN